MPDIIKDIPPTWLKAIKELMQATSSSDATVDAQGVNFPSSQVNSGEAFRRKTFEIMQGKMELSGYFEKSDQAANKIHDFVKSQLLDCLLPEAEHAYTSYDWSSDFHRTEGSRAL